MLNRPPSARLFYTAFYTLVGKTPEIDPFGRAGKRVLGTAEAVAGRSVLIGELKVYLPHASRIPGTAARSNLVMLAAAASPAASTSS